MTCWRCGLEKPWAGYWVDILRAGALFKGAPVCEECAVNSTVNSDSPDTPEPPKGA